MSDNFLKKLNNGQKTQHKVAWRFYLDGWGIDPQDVGGRYDFVAMIRMYEERIEVKDEDNQTETGNICIETHQGISRKPSGIMISESTVTIHTLGEFVALYRTQPMRNWLKDNKHKYKLVEEFKNADNYNGGYIIPIKDLKQYGWFDFCYFKKLSQSKVFQPARRFEYIRGKVD